MKTTKKTTTNQTNATAKTNPNATTTDTNTTNAKTVNPFATLLTAYANDPTNETTLTDLAKAVAYSVLKKCIDTSGNKALIQARQDLTRDLANLDRIAYATANAYETAYTADGDRVQRVKDKDLANGLTKLCKESFGDGLDLMHDAIIAILDETAKQAERDPDQPTDLERPYTVRRLKKKVWIKTADSVNGWETVETTPIQEIYKAVRRSIQASRAVQSDPRNGYTYLEDISTDPETDADTVIYRRFGKYADIGGYATDYNGKETFYTADTETADTLDTLTESLNLTARQAQILSLRMRGYGYKAIATYLAIRPDSVRDCMQAIQKKAVAIGLTPTK